MPLVGAADGAIVKSDSLFQSQYEDGLRQEALRETKGWVKPSVGSAGRRARKELLGGVGFRSAIISAI